LAVMVIVLVMVILMMMVLLSFGGLCVPSVCKPSL
jgi:hypothetical protein